MVKQKHKYIFPNFLAEVMNRVDQRTQFEASMLSMFFILIGIILSAIFTIFFTDLGIFWKVSVASNGFFAFIFISSGLVTQYQQYVTYMEAINVEKEIDILWKNENKNMPKM